MISFTQENLQKCIDFINKFKGRFLDNDIYNLVNFSFLNLSDNEIYHIRKDITEHDIKTFGGYYIKLLKDGSVTYTGHHYIDDYDDFNITRAINYVLYHDKLPKIEWEDFKWEYEGEKPRNPLTFRGETINTYQTLIGDENYNKEFLGIVFSIGNFMGLPNYGYSKRRLNMIKGNCNNNYKDYADLFFMDLYPNGKLANDGELRDIINLNKDYLPQTFSEFCKIFYLEDYMKDGEPTIVFTKNKINKPYCYWEKLIDPDGYNEFIKQYIEISTKIIQNRAMIICEELKKYGI